MSTAPAPTPARNAPRPTPVGTARRRAAVAATVATANADRDMAEADAVFESVASLFALLSTPIRLKIIGALCRQERNVSQLIAELATTQPNMSQHLGVLHRAGVLGRRRVGTQVLYHLRDERVGRLCRTVCTQAAIDLQDEPSLPALAGPPR